MTTDLNYKVTIGSQNAGSKDDDRLMISFTTEIGMDCGCGYSVIELADETYTLPVSGDEITIDLGDELTRVFTGEVETVETISAGQRITAYDSLSKLAKHETETVYKEVTIDEIVSDLLSECKIKTGKLEKSTKIPSFVVFKGARVFQHIQKLAQMSGMDIYSDGMGLVNFAGPETKGKEHSFEYGINILELNIRKTKPVHDSIQIIGEGSAGTKGADKYFWLPDDLSGLKGIASTEDGNVTSGKKGNFSVCEVIPALRSGEAVDKIAQARMKSKAAQLFRGYIKIYGYPEAMPGDIAIIKKLPKHHSLSSFFSSSGSLRIRNVRHFYNLQNGFLTRLDF